MTETLCTEWATPRAKDFACRYKLDAVGQQVLLHLLEEAYYQGLACSEESGDTSE